MKAVELDIKEVAQGLRFPEGPVAMPDGSVLVVEMTGGALSRVSPGGQVSVVAECGGGPNGAAIGPDGAVYVCNNGGGMADAEGSSGAATGVPSPGPSIQRVDLESGEVDVVYTECDGRAFRRPNDLVFDTDGGFYFTDFGQPAVPPLETMTVGGVFYGKADGSGVRKVSGPALTANGIGLSPDGGRLYMAETFTARVWYWDIEAPGVVPQTQANFFSPPGAQLLCGLGGLKPLDSLAVDAAGNVCVGTLQTSGLSIISPTGEPDFLPIPGDPLITNICFGGRDLTTAWITASGSGRLLTAKWPRPGLKLAY
jgi:gluconolactonase